jgi:hypothetical protein
MTCQPPIIRQKESSKHWGIISFVYGLSPEKTLPLIYAVKEAVFSIFGFSIPHIIVTRGTLKMVQHVIICMTQRGVSVGWFRHLTSIKNSNIL